MSNPDGRQLTTQEWIVGAILVAYLMVTGLGAVALVIGNFPSERAPATSATASATDSTAGQELRLLRLPPDGAFAKQGFSVTQGMILIALCAGIAGSFLHAAQSLSSYLGNRTFKISWTPWYFLRPWVGALLGLGLYLTFSAGFLGLTVTGLGSDGDIDSPYAVVALSFLGGWFSKKANDKLKEVFDTLFTTKEDEKRSNKLNNIDQPTITGFYPKPVPPGTHEIIITGQHFQEGATVLVDGAEHQAIYESAAILRLDTSSLGTVPTGSSVKIAVKNPDGLDPISAAQKLEFS